MALSESVREWSEEAREMRSQRDIAERRAEAAERVAEMLREALEGLLDMLETAYEMPKRGYVGRFLFGRIGQGHRKHSAITTAIRAAESARVLGESETHNLVMESQDDD